MNAKELVEKLNVLIDNGHGSCRVVFRDHLEYLVNIREPKVKTGFWYREETIDGCILETLTDEDEVWGNEVKVGEETIIIID